MAKKKAGNKVTKDETEEERTLRLEQEALAAEEKGRKGVELARVALRRRQQQEQQYAHLNGIKIHNQWRKIMRLAKVEELRHEIEILSQNHEREVDGKDAAIQMLDRDLEEAEEQYQAAIRSHLAVVDSLLTLQYQRMRALEAEFTSDLHALQDEFDGECNEVSSSHNRARKDLTDMMTAMSAEFTDAESDARQEYESAREEVKNRNSEEYNVLKIQLESIIDDLERHFEHAHKAYLESTEHRASAFKTLTKNDADSARIIEQRMKKLVRMQEDLHHWRTKISASSSEWEARNGALRREKELMARHYSSLKASLDAQRAAQAERLKALSLHSSASIQGLQQKLDKADTILKLAAMCRKLETDREKVLPFHSPDEGAPSFVSAELQQAEEGCQERGQAGEAGPSGKCSGLSGRPRSSAAGVDAQGHDVEEWDYLNLFFKRYNKALLDVFAIEHERERLNKENGELRQLLKQFLDGISISDNVINNPANPLLVVNQRLQLAMAQRRQARTASATGTGPASGRLRGSAGRLDARSDAVPVGSASKALPKLVLVPAVSSCR